MCSGIFIKADNPFHSRVIGLARKTKVYSTTRMSLTKEALTTVIGSTRSKSLSQSLFVDLEGSRNQNITA